MKDHYQAIFGHRSLRVYAVRLCHVLIFATQTVLLAQTPMVQTLTPTAFPGSGGVAVDAAGEVYVADFGTTLSGPFGTTVSRVSRSDGSVTVFANGLLGASGNSFDNQGNLIQSNIAANKISRIDPQGNVTDFATVGIVSPVGIAIDNSGNVYVANCGNASIRKIDTNGNSTTFVSSGLLSCPNGLTIDAGGNLYTANFNNGNVIKIEPGGQASVFATIPGNNNGHLTFANNRLYVVARCANQIYEVSLTGEATLLAGSGLRGRQDGPATEASFSIPNGIRASPDGDTLYVNDAFPLSGGCFSGNLDNVIVRMITGVRSVVGTGAEVGLQPQTFRLEQNVPNPFNPSTRIRFNLPSGGSASLKVYDLAGREVATLFNGQRSAGAGQIDFNAAALPSGIYFYRLEAAGFAVTRKMALLR